jgi:glycosyltransferase involved in cell wall biosynthesis
MKLLYFRKVFPKTSETFLLTEITGLIEYGADVRILAGEFKDGIRHPAYLKHNLFERTIYNPRFYFDNKVPSIEELTGIFGNAELADVQSRHYKNPIFKPDIIVAPYGTMSSIYECFILGEFLKRKFVVTFRADDIYIGLDPITWKYEPALRRAVKRRISKPLLNEAAAVFTTSSYNREVLSSMLEKGQEIVAYHSGVDCSFYHPSKNPSTNQNSLLCIGRFEEKKGIENLINACSLLKSRMIPFSLKIIGEGPLKKTYNNLIVDLGLTSQITVDGPFSSDVILKHLQEASVFILPSIITETGSRDILATVLQEAMACERSVVTTELPGNEELITHRENGLLVPMNSVKELADAIQELLGSPQFRKQLGCAARATIIKKFNAEATKKTLFDALHRLSGAE